MANIKSAFSVVLLVLALGACRTKQAQCSDIIDTYNALGEEIRKGIGDGTDPAAIEKSADAIDEKVKAFAAVDVAEDKLKSARDGLAETAGKHTKLLRTMAGLIRDAKDPAKADGAVKKLDGTKKDFEAIASAFGSHKQSIMTVCNATAK